MRWSYSLSEYIFFTAAVFSGLLTAAVFGFLFFFGLPLLQSGQLAELLFSSWAPDKGLYGIYPMLLSSFTLASLSMIISFPVSIGCSFIITALAPIRLRRVLLALIRVMTGIPTVVYSFAALFFFGATDAQPYRPRKRDEYPHSGPGTRTGYSPYYDSFFCK